MNEPRMLDLGNVMGGSGTEGPPGPPPSQDAIREAILGLNTDAVPTQGSNNLMTSGAIFNAFNSYTRDREFVELDAPTTLGPQLNRELYYGNGGYANRTLAIELPAVASEGDTFFLEFRSQGTADVPAVIESFSVEDGGLILKKGEIDPNAYVTRITASYCFGIWIAQIITFVPSEGQGIPPMQTSGIIYDGTGFAGLANGTITCDGRIGVNKLLPASSLTPNGSDYSFGNLYGMTFNGWNTSPDGSGSHYKDTDLIVLDSTEPVRLYPQYESLEITRSDSVQLSDYYNTGSKKTFTLKPNLAAAGIANYAELAIEAKIYAAIHTAHNGSMSSIEYQQENGTWAYLVSPGGDASQWRPTEDKRNTWVTMTRQTNNEDFSIKIRTDSWKDDNIFRFYIAAIKIKGTHDET